MHGSPQEATIKELLEALRMATPQSSKDDDVELTRFGGRW